MTANDVVRRHTIRTRMRGALAMVPVLLAMLGGAGLFGLSRLNTLGDEFIRTPYADTLSLADLHTGLSNVRRFEKEVGGFSDASAANKAMDAGSSDLSSRTAQTAGSLQQAAGSVQQLTGTVRQTADSAHTANQLASSAQASAAKGGQVVSQVVSAMDAINTSSKKLAEITGETTAPAAEQSKGIGQLNQAVTQLDHVTQKNTALVEESAAVASLEAQAGKLVASLAAFRLSDLPAAPNVLGSAARRKES